MKTSLALFALGLATAATAQTSTGTLTAFSLPGYLGTRTALTTATPSTTLAARSLRVTGSWQVCSAVDYAGTCETITASQPFSRLTIRSARPSPNATTATATPTASTSVAAAATINLDALDPGAGTNGQDVEFYAQPAFGSDQVSAGTNDKTAADAFCKRAGATNSVYASRGRVQVSNLIDLATATRVRAYPLRDVLCRR